MAKDCKYFMKPNAKLYHHFDTIHMYYPKFLYKSVAENYLKSEEEILVQIKK